MCGGGSYCDNHLLNIWLSHLYHGTYVTNTLEKINVYLTLTIPT